MKIFIDIDSDIRLARRLQRDIHERGRDVIGVITQYQRFVKPAYDCFIAPTMAHADLIVPHGGENRIAVDLIVKHATHELQKVKFNENFHSQSFCFCSSSVAFK